MQPSSPPFSLLSPQVRACLDEMQALLEEQYKFYCCLRDLLQTETLELKRAGAEALLDLQTTKYQIAAQVKRLEKIRQTVVGQLAELWSLSPTTLHLKEIVPRVEPRQGEILKTLHQDLLAVIGEIQTLSQKNAHESQIRWNVVNTTLAVVAEGAQMHPVYSGTGTLRHAPPTFHKTSV